MTMPLQMPLAPWDRDAVLDHAAALRTNPAALRALWEDPESHVFEIDVDNRFRDEPFGAPITGSWQLGTVFLGLIEGRAWFARRSQNAGQVSLREARLDDAQRQVVSAGAATLNWLGAAKHCERCGGPLQPNIDGYSAKCLGCDRQSFPRTDPAVIMAILDGDDRLLLAHQTGWSAGRVSILAGFVEAGESTENAVHREVREESALELSALRYLGSQPWPFPRSLMFGYVARSTGQPIVDGVELAWADWFSRERLSDCLASGELAVPGPGSIARRILDAWRERRLPSPEN